MASSSIAQLRQELKALKKQPVEGFQVSLPSEDVMSVWHVNIFGPPDTLYQGGCFKAELSFPEDYPYSPPEMRFLTRITHPNVYPDGKLCISILHRPSNDPSTAKLSLEWWNPTQSVRTILLSVVSLLNEPNVTSAANPDASTEYKKWIDSRGADKEYESIIRKDVEDSREQAEKEGIKVPTTLEEYCQKTAEPDLDSQSDLDDGLDYDYDEYSSECDEEDYPEKEDEPMGEDPADDNTD